MARSDDVLDVLLDRLRAIQGDMIRDVDERRRRLDQLHREVSAATMAVETLSAVVGVAVSAGPV